MLVGADLFVGPPEADYWYIPDRRGDLPIQVVLVFLYTSNLRS